MPSIGTDSGISSKIKPRAGVADGNLSLSDSNEWVGTTKGVRERTIVEDEMGFEIDGVAIGD